MPSARSLPRSERRPIAMLVAAIGGLHLVGIGLLALTVPQHLTLGAGGGAFGVGLGVTAYTLGLRHAFDADHISAIDNTTRKLIADDRRPLTVGFWFSLGHSSVVLALAVLLALGLRGLRADVADDGSGLQHAAGVIGPVVSGSFLVIIGLTNLVTLRGVARQLREAPPAEAPPLTPGPVGRLLSRAMRTVDRPWKMYAIGLLFGLGFDTATEIALLATAGAAATGGLPLSAILCLPILFAAGMTLLDTLDGAFMRYAYGWATAEPRRVLHYNFAITGLSVLVALLIGGIELAQVLTDRLDGPDLNLAGYVIAALFALTWLAALASRRLGATAGGRSA
jgi:high-affinity nickel-transport protein